MTFWRVCFVLLLMLCAIAYGNMQLGSTSAWYGGLLPFLFFSSFVLILASSLYWLYERIEQWRRGRGTGDGLDIGWGEDFASDCSAGNSFGAGDCSGGD